MNPDALKMTISVDTAALNRAIAEMAQSMRQMTAATEPELPIVPVLLAASAAAVATKKRVSRRSLLTFWRMR